jgi:hypothetical protein
MQQAEVVVMMMMMTTATTSNVMVECLTLLLHIQDVPGSNLSPETSYPE